MKQKILKLILTVMTFITLSPLALADNAIDVPYDLLPRPGDPNYDHYYDLDLPIDELKQIGNLPDVNHIDLLITIAKTILGGAMLLTIIAIIVTGFFYLLSQGNEENTTKAKNTIIYLLIGMLIIAAAYGIIAGVSQFDFFKT